MNKFSNGLNVMPDGLSAVSGDELNGVAGGGLLPAFYQMHEPLFDVSSYAAFYQSIADHCKDLAEMSRM